MAKVNEGGFSVVALCSFTPGDLFEFASEEQALTAPHFASQLNFKKGEVFEVLEDQPQWWLFVQSSATLQKGYVPSSLTAPVKKSFLTPDNIRALQNGQRLITRDINTDVELKYFPKAPIGVKNRPVSPEDSASWFSRVIFWWLNGLVMTGFKRPLVDEDLFELSKENKSKVLMPKLINEWEKVKNKHRPHEGDDGVKVKDGSRASIVSALKGVFLSHFIFAAFLKFSHDLIMFAQPILLEQLIMFIGNEIPDQKEWHGYAIAFAMFFVGFFQNFFQQQYFIEVFKLGLRTRTSLLGLLYRKAFKLSNDSKKKSTVGEMVNLMSVDTQRLNDMITYINMMWSGPLQISIALYFLFQTMGVSILAGVAVLIFLIPFNLFVSNIMKKMQVKLMGHKDERIKIMNEVLNGIKVIKLYAWEDSFMDKIKDIRNQELRQLRNIAYVNAITMFMWVCSPFLVSLATFSTYVLSGNELTASKAFVAISLFNILRFPMSVVPMIISQYIQARVSVNRINDFLNLDELDSESILRSEPQKYAEVLKVENGKFSWSLEEKEILDGINLSITKGSLVAVVGQVGSGKSSLLSALLGEMEKLEGNVHVKGSLAYVPQQAWVQNTTLRENVLFGKGLNPKRYCKVINSCALATDLDMLPGGDMTEIGEKGINLSGGQKQRVSLARAVYHDTDIYLLDDPLSAVDSHVGKHIFDNVIGPNGMLQKKTRVLVTHGIGFLPEVDQIIVVHNGVISEVGTYQELLNNQGAFSEFLKTYANEEDTREEDTDVQRQQSVISYDRLDSVGSIGSAQSIEDLTGLSDWRNSESHTRVRTVSVMSSNNPEQKEKCLNMLQDKKENKMIEDETSNTGNVQLSVFLIYMKSIGIIISTICILCILCSEGSIIGARVWLAYWTTSDVASDTSRDMFLGVYASLGLSQGLVMIIFSFAQAFGAIRASRNLHNSLLLNILRSPMSFFETTPIGRIVNRFSKDIFNLDETIPRSMRAFLSTLTSVFGTLFVISYSIPLFLTVIIPLGAMYFFTQRFYVATSRQLKRLESVSRSPIYNHFFESINGTSTIRAFKQQDRFIEENGLKIDGNQRAFFPSIVANRWLAFRLELVGNCIVLFAVLFAVVGRDSMDKGLVGLAVTYAISVTSSLNWMVRMTSEIETNIVAVERIKEYSETPTEADWVVSSNRPDESWPQDGKVEFDQYSTRYREGLDLVVKSISSTVKGGEKIGIVGRTGAGKSSLTLALFRVIESAEGRIVIDGVNIAEIGLHDLRKHLTIIPQDPVLFSGSLRFNLDPFEKYTDEELWNVLEVAHLKQFASTLPEGLQHTIAEGGNNLSVGQRQLVCLARALLRKTKILILDEATAAVDLETDELIQQTIRKVFVNCTVLTIAHRLNTVMDYDRILVLSAGEVAEFDSPKNLINSEGIFYSMVKDAGLI